VIYLSEEGAKIIEEHRVACITTNSLREILKLFPMQGEKYTYLITRLRARASNMEPDKPLVDDKDYGIKAYLDRHLDSFYMDYELKFDEEGRPRNPIDVPVIKKIEDAMHKVGIEDAAVEFVKVLIRDPKIGELAGIPEELFHATIVSDPVDGDKDREKVKEHKVNDALIKESGFKHRILHTRKLIDRKQELTVPLAQQKPIIWWTGKTVYSLHSPIKVAQRLREHFGEYKLIKTYGAGLKDILVLLSVER
jgi:hypothetical protein